MQKEILIGNEILNGNEILIGSEILNGNEILETPPLTPPLEGWGAPCGLRGDKN
jgi:hypothetical protein